MTATAADNDGDSCRGLTQWLCRLWRAIKRRKRGDPCVYLPDRVVHKPDPCIYSQFLLMQLEQPVTWDNPDIAAFLGGVEQNTYDLVVDTSYDIVVTVHNASRDKPALGTVVDIRWIEFGAGGQIRHPIATEIADVGVWPATSTVTALWRTPAIPGHYCIEVELSHPDDGNPGNNRGWNNTLVKPAASRVDTPIRIFNRWVGGCPTVRPGAPGIFLPRAFAGAGLLGVPGGGVLGNIIQSDYTTGAAVAWGIGGYAAGSALGLIFELVRSRWRRRGERRPDHEAVPCELVEISVDGYRFEDGVGKDVRPDAMFAPRPPAWPARVEPSLFQFQQGEAYRDVLLIVDAPDDQRSQETFNVNVRQGDSPTGGVTVTVVAGG